MADEPTVTYVSNTLPQKIKTQALNRPTVQLNFNSNWTVI